MVTPPILDNKNALMPSVFVPTALLREARRQKKLDSVRCRQICIWTPMATWSASAAERLGELVLGLALLSHGARHLRPGRAAGRNSGPGRRRVSWEPRGASPCNY